MISYFVYYCYGASRTPKRGTSRCVSDTLWFLSFSRDSFNKHLWNFSLLLRKCRVVVGDVPWKSGGVLNFYGVLAQLLSRKIWKGIDFERPFTVAGFPSSNERYLLTPCQTTAGAIKVSQTSEALSRNPDLVNGWKIKSSKQASDKDTKQQSRICCQWRFHHRLECYLVLSLLIIWLRSRRVVCVLAVCDYTSRVERVFSRAVLEFTFFITNNSS